MTKKDLSHWVNNKRPKGAQLSLTQYGQRSRKKNPEQYLISVAKQRAKRKQIYFNITKKDIKVPKNCPVLSFPLEFSIDGSSGGKFNSPSLDRIDPSLGYIPGNVQVISLLANNMKSYANKEQLITFANWILKEYTN